MGDMVVERIAALERSNVWLRKVATLSCSSTALVFALAYVSFSSVVNGTVETKLPSGASPQATPAANTIVAERLLLKDSAGRIRGEFTITEKGDVRIAMRDDAGNVRASLGVFPDGPGLTLVNKADQPRVELECREGDKASLRFTDGQGKVQMVLQHAKATSFALSDSSGNPRILQMVDQIGPRVVLLSADNVPKAILHTRKDNPELYLTKDGDAKLVALAVGPTGNALVLNSGGTGSTMATLAIGPEGEPFLGLCDKKGNPLVVASVSHTLGGMLHVQDIAGRTLLDVPRK